MRDEELPEKEQQERIIGFASMIVYYKQNGYSTLKMISIDRTDLEKAKFIKLRKSKEIYPEMRKCQNKIDRLKFELAEDDSLVS